MAESDKNLHLGRSPVETDVDTAYILYKKVREVKDATGLTELEAQLDDLVRLVEVEFPSGRPDAIFASRGGRSCARKIRRSA